MSTRGVVTCVLAAVLAARGASGWEVGVAPATRKVLPDTPMPVEAHATLAAARNEWEAFQIVIRDAAGARGVDLELSDLDGPGGARIAASNARAYREHYLNVKTPSGAGFGLSNHQRTAGLYPDPLIPLRDPYDANHGPVGAPFDLAAGETATLFVDWLVPSGTPPGFYSGAAVLSAASGQRTEVPIALTVWELDMPTARTVATAFRASASAPRLFHGGPGAMPNARYAPIPRRYFQALHEHRIDPTTVSAPVDYQFDAQGTLEPVDWTAYDAAVAPFLDGSFFDDGVGVARFDIGGFSPGHGTGSMTDDQYQQAARAFAEHLQSKGWWSRAYTYGADEPWLNDPDHTYPAIQREVGLLLGASDLWKDKLLITGPWVPQLTDQVGIWCPNTAMYGPYSYIHVQGRSPGWNEYTPLLAAGAALWFYVANADLPPFAGYDIDTRSGYEPRIVKWGAWFERATGFLYWGTSFWIKDDPWNNYQDTETFAPIEARNGDGFLFYPGDHDGTAMGKGSPAWLAIDGPIVSYRMKQIRDGLEDWELFRMAAAAGIEAFTRAEVGRAYRQFGTLPFENCSRTTTYCPDNEPWTLDENVLLDARRRIAAKLLHQKFPDRYADPDADALTPASDGEGCDLSRRAAPRTPLAMIAAAIALAARRRARRRPATPLAPPTGRTPAAPACATARSVDAPGT